MNTLVSELDDFRSRVTLDKVPHSCLYVGQKVITCYTTSPNQMGVITYLDLTHEKMTITWENDIDNWIREPTRISSFEMTVLYDIEDYKIDNIFIKLEKMLQEL